MYIAAEMEYSVVQVLELAKNGTCDNTTIRIIPRPFQLAIRRVLPNVQDVTQGNLKETLIGLVVLV